METIATALQELIAGTDEIAGRERALFGAGDKDRGSFLEISNAGWKRRRPSSRNVVRRAPSSIGAPPRSPRPWPTRQADRGPDGNRRRRDDDRHQRAAEVEPPRRPRKRVRRDRAGAAQLQRARSSTASRSCRPRCAKSRHSSNGSPKAGRARGADHLNALDARMLGAIESFKASGEAMTDALTLLERETSLIGCMSRRRPPVGWSAIATTSKRRCEVAVADIDVLAAAIPRLR